MRVTVRLAVVGVALSALLTAATRADAHTVYACVNDSSGEVKIVAPGTVCHKNETLQTWGATEYGVAQVLVQRGSAGTPTVWAQYSIPLGTAAVQINSATPPFIGSVPFGDDTGGTFRFTCNNTSHGGDCRVSWRAMVLSDDAGGARLVWPRILIHRQSYTAGGPSVYCEYGDHSDNDDADQLVPATPFGTVNPAFTPSTLGIGGSADCGVASVDVGGSHSGIVVAEIKVPDGYYDVWSSFKFYKAPVPAP